MKVKHKAFGNISVSRTTIGGKGQPMYGSKIRHAKILSFTISESEISSTDDGMTERYFSGRQILRFSMTDSQFQEFISSVGYGPGTPITLEYRPEENAASEFVEMPKDFIPDRKRVYSEALREMANDKMKATNELLMNLERRLTRGSLDPDDLKDYKAKIKALQASFISSAEYYGDMFDNEMEKSMEEFKNTLKNFQIDKQNNLIGEENNG